MLATLFDETYVPAVVVVCLVLLLLYKAVWPVSLDPREPPILRPKIPVIGHLLSLVHLRYQYHFKIVNKYNMAAYTLPILGGKLYVASTPRLASAVFRKRSLVFQTHDFLRLLVGLDEDAMRMWKSHKFQTAFFSALYRGLSGQSLIDLTTAVVRNAGSFLDDVPGARMHVHDFYGWTRQIVATSTTAALYGSKSPWAIPAIMRSFWTYHDEMHKFLFTPAPSVMAPRLFNARADLQTAIEAYIQKGAHLSDDVPRSTKDRIAAGQKLGMAAHDTGKIEIGLVIAALANTSTVMYWLLAHLYNQPDLLARVREELSNVIHENHSAEGVRQMTLQLAWIKDKCPLFFSCLQETQRRYIVDNINRTVTADTTITDGDQTYLLKRGENIQVPLSVLHGNPEVWGADADRWIGNRFMNPCQGMPPPGYLPFGGGKHQCPGRHLARGVMLGAAAQVILGLDIKGADEGPVVLPEAQIPWPTTGIGRPEPGRDLRVTIGRRTGWEKVRWEVA